MAENIQYQKVKEITDQLEQGIQDLFESEKYMAWLRTMSKFHDYSLNNTLLIAFQRPDASLVAGYTAWQKQFGRQVQKGEKAIKILAPAPYKEKVEMDKIDPITQVPVLDAEGNPVKEIQEVKRPAFKVVNVFDVSQTDGKELPSLGVDELSGDVREYELFFEALKRSCPVPMEFEAIEGSAKGYYHQMEQRIAIREGMSQIQTIKTAIHEMAHQRLHAIDPLDEKSEIVNQTRSSKEVEAESVAFTVCQHYGIDTSDYSFAYVAGWSHGKETPELKASLNTIRKTANEMITEIDGHITEINKEMEQENKITCYLKISGSMGSEYEIDRIAGTVEQIESALKEVLEKEIENVAEYLESKGIPVLLVASSIDDEPTGHIQPDYEYDMDRKQIFRGNEAIGLEMTREEATISFYVAECMEFPNLGKYHDNLTLSEAMKLYEKIPAERMNGVKGIGFELHDGSMYDGQYPLMEAGKVDEELINMVEHYKNSPLVQQAIADCKEMLGNKERFEFAKDLYEKGFVYEDYVISSVEAHDLREDGVEPLYFSDEQLKIIKKGLKEGLDITAINNPDLSVDEMKKGLREIRKEHREYLKSITPTEDGKQENGNYRYYSTQRPVMPGGYPKPFGNEPVVIVNYDSRQTVENSKVQAWGYLEYALPLTPRECADYELKAISSEKTRANAQENSKGKKKSVLADLHEKQEKVSSTNAPKQTKTKKQTKEIE